LLFFASENAFHRWPKSASLAALLRPGGKRGRCSLQKLMYALASPFLACGAGASGAGASGVGASGAGAGAAGGAEDELAEAEAELVCPGTK
jgi:hypothetical protein